MFSTKIYDVWRFERQRFRIQWKSQLPHLNFPCLTYFTVGGFPQRNSVFTKHHCYGFQSQVVETYDWNPDKETAKSHYRKARAPGLASHPPTQPTLCSTTAHWVHVTAFKTESSCWVFAVEVVKLYNTAKHVDRSHLLLHLIIFSKQVLVLWFVVTVWLETKPRIFYLNYFNKAEQANTSSQMMFNLTWFTFITIKYFRFKGHSVKIISE